VSGVRRLEERLASFYLGFFTWLRLDPRRWVPVDPAAKKKIAYAGLNMTETEYSAFILGNSLAAFLAALIFYGFLSYFYSFSFLYAVLFAVLMLLVGLYASLHYINYLVLSRVKDVELNILAAARNMLADVRAGITLFDAMRNVARGNYGVVSTLMAEAAALSYSEGESAEWALRRVKELSPSETFQRFVANLSSAMSIGTGPESALQNFIREIEASQRYQISIYASEATKLGMFAFILTAIVPGLLLYMLPQMQFLLNIKIGVVLLLPFYMIIFPLMKYFILIKLVRISPGV
jgi:pilus assembly protein TadC